MDSKEIKQFYNPNSFSPWEFEHQRQPFSLKEASKTIDKVITKETTLRNKRFKGQSIIKEDLSMQNTAKKTLMDVSDQTKQQKVIHLREYLQRKRLSLNQNKIDKSNRDLVLPMIKKSELILQNKSRVKLQKNSHSLVIVNKINIDNQEEEVFKKYGSHRKPSSKVQRSISFGSAIMKSQHSIDELHKKYHTIDIRQDKEVNQKPLKALRLKGKKFSLDQKSKPTKNEQEFSYMPSQPNITPYYILFGHRQEDVLKNVFQQIQHRLK